MKHVSLAIVVMLFLSIGYSQIRLEAEDGQLNGTQIENSIIGFSGTGYVTGFDSDDDQVTLSVVTVSSGSYKLSIGYNASSYKEQQVYVNGLLGGKIILPQSEGFEEIEVGGIYLPSGTNTISITKDWGFFQFDYLVLTPLPPHDYNVQSDLIDLNVDSKTIALWEYLKTQFGKKVITGQTHYYDELTAIAGKRPKQQAFDFQSYTQGYPYKWDNGIGGHSFGWQDNGVTDEIINWYQGTQECGIVSVQWHWHSPNGGAAGTNTFYTNQTSFDITKAVDPSQPEYDMVIEDIDSVATQLKKLQLAGVPVLWRPLHEAGGGWFWWGAKTSEACLALWDIMYERLTNFHDLHNLIWVWSTPETEWYPGNDKIDVFGYDSYPGAYVYSVQKSVFDHMYALSNGEKILAMTENGAIPDVDQMIEQDAMWVYFSSWNDLVVDRNTTAHIQATFSHDSSINLDDDPCGVVASSDEMDYVNSNGPFPNPFTDYLQLSKTTRWSLVDTHGQQISSGIGEVVNTALLPIGVYILQLENGLAYKLLKK